MGFDTQAQNRPAHTSAPTIQLLEKNLAALGPGSERAAAQIRGAAASLDLTWATGSDGAPTGSLGAPPRQLASLRAPLAEAEKFAASVDISAAACVVVRGFGLGHHVAALARRLRQHGAIIVFEPDLALLRAVLERVDCSPWLSLSNVRLVTDAEETGAIAAAASGIEAVLAAGTVLVDHPPSKARLGDLSERFAQQFTNVMKAVRTNVVTTLVQVDATVENLLMNLAWYATVPGVADLAGSCKGKPAVVVSAGPSLRRNLDLLSKPGVRDRVVIIAVQTVLKTLLAKGIRPHFVTALDYHEISRRFYEGLTAGGVEGVTLVAEPKCNRAIFEAFPGRVRCTGDHVLDQVLGPTLARPMGTIPPGATVAHLAYYLARHLGCDPVILIGQDLGFTDGQYYAPGAAIHQVWSSELNEFRTLEMMEWERIVRMRSLLRKVQDHSGRPIYTDEQMSTYLVQFERDFMHDASRSLTTIDATEGGVRKKHTSIMRLDDALDKYTSAGPVALPATPEDLGNDRLTKVLERLRELRQSALRISELGHEAQDVLTEMLGCQQNVGRVNRLISRVESLGREAASQGAFWIVQYINQTGQFNRYRADRAIHIDVSLSSMEKQKREIQRDIVNVRWLADAADHIGALLETAMTSLTPTGDATDIRSPRRPQAPEADPGAGVAATADRPSIWAIIAVEANISGLCTPRDLGRPFALGMNPLQMTLARLAQARRLDGALLLCADAAEARRLVGTPPRGLRVEFEPVNADALRKRIHAVGQARLWSRHCWRGGIANLSCFDESFSPALVAPVMESRAIDAAVIVGADWSLVDPALVDLVIERHLERPDVNQLTFTQAPPGLGACVIGRHAVTELAAANSPLASIGGLLGYVPLAPQSDPIAKPSCVMVSPTIRDLLARCIPDSGHRRAALAAALAPLGTRALSAGALELAGLIAVAPASPCFGIEMVTIEPQIARGIVPLASLAGLADDIALTILDDSTGWRASTDFIAQARAAGFAGIHIKTPLSGGLDQARALLDAGPDVVSVLLGGFDDPPQPLAALQHLLEARAMSLGMPSLWVVPRLTRKDATYEHIESFYDRWILSAGASAIDPLPAPLAGERIESLPTPANVQTRAKASTLVIRADGAITDGGGQPLGSLATEDLEPILTRAGLSHRTSGASAPISMAS